MTSQLTDLIVNGSPRDNDLDTPSNYLVSSDKFLLTEHNPFEQSFSSLRPGSSSGPNTVPSTTTAPTNGTETPKPALPGVLEMFTPGGTNQYDHFNFAESLRHGPLSPNLLNGPQAPLSFDPSSFRTGLTPNESNIRTGLTPGGNGSLVPGGAYPMLPTPGTAALLGPYTPNTASAIASMQSNTFSVPAFNTAGPGRGANDPFGENQAANGLVFLAQTSQQQAHQPIPVPREDLGKRGSIVSLGGGKPGVNVYQDPAALMNNNSKAKEDTNTGKGRGKKKDEGLSAQNVNGKESAGPNKKTKKSQETDDEKRRNFLERNRQGTSLSSIPLSLHLKFSKSGMLMCSCFEV
jgi:ATF/CREB family transcription factor